MLSLIHIFDVIQTNACHVISPRLFFDRTRGHAGNDLLLEDRRHDDRRNGRNGNCGKQRRVVKAELAGKVAERQRQDVYKRQGMHGSEPA